MGAPLLLLEEAELETDIEGVLDIGFGASILSGAEGAKAGLAGEAMPTAGLDDSTVLDSMEAPKLGFIAAAAIGLKELPLLMGDGLAGSAGLLDGMVGFGASFDGIIGAPNEDMPKEVDDGGLLPVALDDTAGALTKLGLGRPVAVDPICFAGEE